MAIQRNDFIPYPTGVLKFIYRVPLLLHRAGLGVLLRPFNLMVLTTTGRKSGKARHVVLEYRRHGSKIYVVSGWGERPHWVKNVIADETATVQLGAKDRPVRGYVVEDPAEAVRALYMFQNSSPIAEAILAQMSSADDFNLRTIKKVVGEFTVVRLDLLTGDVKLSGVRATHAWIGATAILSLATAVIMIIAQRTPTAKSMDSVLESDIGDTDG